MFFLLADVAEARGFARPSEGQANETPANLKDIGIEPHLGEKLNLDLPFVDHDGRAVTLRELMRDGKPILLSLAYYSCPSLCNFHLNGLNDAFKQLEKPIGAEFKLVVMSFDPREKPALAKAKRANYLKEYARPDGDAGWYFLTGEQSSIDPMTKAIGFNYRWDEEQKQYAHASAAYAIALDGTITRYLFGISFEPKTIRLSMLEASKGQIGSIVDKLILYCFHFDPKASKYTLAAFNLMRAGGVIIVLVLGMFLFPFWIRHRRLKSGPERKPE